MRHRRLIERFWAPLNFTVRRTLNTTAPVRRRPGGITVSCLLLGYLAFAAFVGVIVIPKGFVSGSPLVLRVRPATAGAILSVMSLAYGVSALTATVGLWRMRNWAPRAYLLWVGAVCGFTLAFLAVVPLPPDTPPLLAVAFVVFVTILFFGWWRYIQKAYGRSGAL